MSNWVDLHLDVLASCPAEISQIERALQNPCDELIAWRAQQCGEAPKEIAGNVKEIVSFKPVRNLGYVDPSVNKARRFENEWKGPVLGPGLEPCVFRLPGLSECDLLGSALG